MKSFRTTQRSPGSQPVHQRLQQGIVSQVIADLTNGMTIRQCAQTHQLPHAFIEQIVEFAQQTGQLNLIDMQQCASSVCHPDPDSIVCAGCPLATRTQAHRHVFGRWVKRLHQHL